jgi:hypothetical protein
VSKSGGRCAAGFSTENFYWKHIWRILTPARLALIGILGEAPKNLFSIETKDLNSPVLKAMGKLKGFRCKTTENFSDK